MSSKACERIGACVIIPVYNHSRTVGDVVKGSFQHANTVLVCDDGSTDGSGAAAKAAGAEVLTHETNRGKGGGYCFSEGVCQTYEDAGDGKAFSTTLIVDGPNRLRLLTTELLHGKAVRFMRQTLVKRDSL